jgi:hypothetical protein
MNVALHRDILALVDSVRQYLPRSEALPWWEDFAELLTQVLVEAARPAAQGNGCAFEAGAGGPPASS